MNEQQKQLVKQWILKAENDLLNVTNNLQAEQTPWDTVCFHCQQAVEKYIKAVLVVHGQEIPRTHDLEQVYNLIQSWVPQIEKHRGELRWLTTYAILSRYPVEVEDAPAGEDEGMRAHKLAQAIQEICRDYLRGIYAELVDDKQDKDDAGEYVEDTQ
jgi:HEPN domain-containing protein